MNKFTALSLLASSALFLSACASNPTQTLAIQKADNQYEVTGLGKDQITAKNNAIVAANKTCGKKAAPVLINEKTEYHGSLNGVVDEQTGKMITAAAGVIGSVMGKNYGIEKDTDYQSTLTFSCKAN
ncbi:hypothetical protein PYR74_14500 [Acinetobacter bereziniae]|jgi:uncharacterized protein (DUF2252 family)|uniref:Uncharacterized protein n=1 Tax=Acinetobacter bereziniae NIPH 3 TaxID=1217651 RepID=N8X881_ACIBZ|nr:MULTISPECIES: hypothetical protein [Acinetobacter]ENV20597.1 hypothetical protein F963_03456 [Acinetobacter bereziniae NIPH 3]KKW76541.1 hypothetical protein AAV97_16545 [Acinetobacter sp. Ag2]MBJ8443607.1 hypothetical protein [Acinetobacter bereziniae]MCM8512028.1 hypothetical protein [Acinetobacter bereziniae]MCU4536352.1 hypothetical protein [Acinetobacter bereziniae]